jgi:hypothetical protein
MNFMRKYFTFFAFIFAFINAMSQDVITKMYDFDSTSATQLFPFPNESDAILSVHSRYSPQDPIYPYYFDFIKLVNGDQFPVQLNEITKIISLPVAYNGKIVFAAKTTNMGEELGIFNGTNVEIIDLNLGANSSEPRLFMKDEKLMIIANDGVRKQLYELTSNFQILKITHETTQDVTGFLSFKGSDYYYITHDTIPNEESNVQVIDVITNTVSSLGVVYYNYELKSIDYADKVFFYTVYRNSSAPWNTVFYDDDMCYAFIYKIDSNNQLTTIYNDSAAYMISPSDFMISSNQLLFYRLNAQKILRLSQNEDSFEIALNLSQVLFIYGHVSKNGKAHLILSTFGSFFSIYELVNMNQGIDHLFSAHYHLHYLTEKDNFRYYVTVEEVDTLYGNLIKFDLLTNNYTIYPITNYLVHPPYFHVHHDGAVWINDQLYFIYGNQDPVDNYDVYTFGSSLHVDELSLNKTKVYPNPTDLGYFQFVSEKESELIIKSLDGKVVQELQIHEGVNFIDVSNLIPGTYIVQTEGDLRKVVIL